MLIKLTIELHHRSSRHPSQPVWTSWNIFLLHLHDHEVQLLRSHDHGHDGDHDRQVPLNLRPQESGRTSLRVLVSMQQHQLVFKIIAPIN